MGKLIKSASKKKKANYMIENSQEENALQRNLEFQKKLKEEKKEHKLKKKRKKGKMSYLDMPNFLIFEEINQNFEFSDKTIFKSKSYNEDKQIKEYFSLVYFKYTPPLFMVNEIVKATNNALKRKFEAHSLKNIKTIFNGISLFDLYASIAKGESLKEILIDFLNKKEIHFFTTSKKETMMEAAIEAKMLFMKIDISFIDFIINFSKNRVSEDGFNSYITALISFVHREEKNITDMNKFSEILDYMYHYTGLAGGRLTHFKDNTKKSYRRLVEESDQWHIEMMFMKNIKSLEWEKVFEDWYYEKNKENIYFIEEITTTKRLSSEGRRMKHCVFSYAQSCSKGYSSILSLSHNDELLLTIEVNKRTNTVVQAKGKLNRAATNSELYLLDEFAKKNNLKISKYL